MPSFIVFPLQPTHKTIDQGVDLTRGGATWTGTATPQKDVWGSASGWLIVDDVATEQQAVEKAAKQLGASVDGQQWAVMPVKRLTTNIMASEAEPTPPPL